MNVIWHLVNRWSVWQILVPKWKMELGSRSRKSLLVIWNRKGYEFKFSFEKKNPKNPQKQWNISTSNNHIFFILIHNNATHCNKAEDQCLQRDHFKISFDCWLTTTARLKQYLYTFLFFCRYLLVSFPVGEMRDVWEWWWGIFGVVMMGDRTSLCLMADIARWNIQQ